MGDSSNNNVTHLYIMPGYAIVKFKFIYGTTKRAARKGYTYRIKARARPERNWSRKSKVLERFAKELKRPDFQVFLLDESDILEKPKGENKPNHRKPGDNGRTQMYVWILESKRNYLKRLGFYRVYTDMKPGDYRFSRVSAQVSERDRFTTNDDPRGVLARLQREVGSHVVGYYVLGEYIDSRKLHRKPPT